MNGLLQLAGWLANEIASNIVLLALASKLQALKLMMQQQQQQQLLPPAIGSFC